MTTIKGTPAAVTAVAAQRDKNAGCPHPFSLLLKGNAAPGAAGIASRDAIWAAKGAPNWPISHN